MSTVLCGIIVCLFVSCDLGDAEDMGSCRLSQAVSGPGNPQKVLDFQINRLLITLNTLPPGKLDDCKC